MLNNTPALPANENTAPTYWICGDSAQAVVLFAELVVDEIRSLGRSALVINSEDIAGILREANPANSTKGDELRLMCTATHDLVTAQGVEVVFAHTSFSNDFAYWLRHDLRQVFEVVLNGTPKHTDHAVRLPTRPTQSIAGVLTLAAPGPAGDRAQDLIIDAVDKLSVCELMAIARTVALRKPKKLRPG